MVADRRFADPCAIQARALGALVIVSCVVKVFDETMNKVRAGSSPRSVSPMSAPSTFETKWLRSCGGAKGASARAAIAGPRSEPPMPMLTTSVIGWPSAPRTRPSRTSAAKLSIFSRAPMISGITSSPSTSTGSPEKLRSAVCSAARLSVILIYTPANIASRLASTLAALASSTSAAQDPGVDALLGIIEQQIVEGDVNALNRAGSSAKRLSPPAPARPRASSSVSRAPPESPQSPWTFPFPPPAVKRVRRRAGTYSYAASPTIARHS